MDVGGLRALARPASTWEKPDESKPSPPKRTSASKSTGPAAAKAGNPKRSGNPAKRNAAAK